MLKKVEKLSWIHIQYRINTKIQSLLEVIPRPRLPSLVDRIPELYCIQLEYTHRWLSPLYRGALVIA